MEGYSLTVIKKCIQENLDKSEICAYIRIIKSLVFSFQLISFQYTNQKANRVANILAKEVLNRRRGFTWWDLLPDALMKPWMQIVHENQNDVSTIFLRPIPFDEIASEVLTA